MSLYDTLGVDKEASQKDIKQAYRDKAKENHEDKGGDNDAMTEINRAYGVLRDPVKRDRYDKTGQESEDSFEFKFQQYVQQLFMMLVDMHDVDHTDLVAEFKEQTAGNVVTLNGKLKDAHKRLKKLNKVVKRLNTGGDNRIDLVVDHNIHSSKQEIASIEEGIKFMSDCLSAIDGYSYEVDEQQPVTWNFTTENWNNPNH